MSKSFNLIFRYIFWQKVSPTPPKHTQFLWDFKRFATHLSPFQWNITLPHLRFISTIIFATKFSTLLTHDIPCTLQFLAPFPSSSTTSRKDYSDFPFLTRARLRNPISLGRALLAKVTRPPARVELQRGTKTCASARRLQRRERRRRRRLRGSLTRLNCPHPREGVITPVGREDGAGVGWFLERWRGGVGFWNEDSSGCRPMIF